MASGIIYIRTYEGFAYLAVIIDLYSRWVIGWTARQTTDVVLQALLMAVWRHKPKDQVLIHSDQAHSSPAWTGIRSSSTTNGMLSPGEFEKRQKI